MDNSINLVDTDQNWAEEKTNYWFEVDGESWAISDQNGDLTLLDCDGCSADERDHDNIKPTLVAMVEKINSEKAA